MKKAIISCRRAMTRGTRDVIPMNPADGKLSNEKRISTASRPIRESVLTCRPAFAALVRSCLVSVALLVFPPVAGGAVAGTGSVFCAGILLDLYVSGSSRVGEAGARKVGVAIYREDGGQEW